MIACTAYMAGYDVKSDQTQTLIYSCLAGVVVNQILKKVATTMVKKISAKMLITINRKVGFRLLTKFGSKG
ncbi:hypothetical protein [Fusobacterium animalis]|uniref:hypothetical protein n=1 Tax=Fusobacterium animalis TaxID=76859 RepID=UPI0034DFF806